jgi:hypothetical protein
VFVGAVKIPAAGIAGIVLLRTILCQAQIFIQQKHEATGDIKMPDECITFNRGNTGLRILVTIELEHSGLCRIPWNAGSKNSWLNILFILTQDMPALRSGSGM